MQKLKNSIIDRMIEQKCTSKEIDFLHYISCYQDSTARVTGVHYKDVCNATKMSIQCYYDTKESLERKGFIECTKRNLMDCDIVIVGNAYTGEQYNKEGYINTNHSIFSCKEFWQLKAGAKLLALKMLIIASSGNGYFQIGVRKFYDNESGYPKRFGVSRRVMRMYLSSIKTLFSIGISNHKYYIEPRKHIIGKRDGRKETEYFREKGTEVVLRRNRIKETGAGKKDLYNLFQQYDAVADKKKKSLVSIIDKAVKKSLQMINEGERWLKHKLINIKLIHKLLREDLYSGSEEKTELCIPTRQVLNQKNKLELVAAQYGGKNKFLNFNQRQYDYDELERILLLKDIPAQP